MIKKLIKLLLVLLLLLTLIISYLSFFGIETTKFNNKIKNSIQGVNKKINLELNSVKFLLKPTNLSINIKTLGPEIFFNNNRLKLEYIKTNISFKSFINNEFSIDDLKISTKTIKLNDIILLAKLLKNSTELFILDKIVKEGFLVADIDLNFDSNGKIKSDYAINGQIKNGKLTLLNKNSIDNLNLFFKIKNKEYLLEDINTKFKEIKLSSPLIKIVEKKDIFLVNGKIITHEKDINVKLLKDLLSNSFKNFEIENLNFNSENDFIFNISKKFKISDLNLKSKIDLNNIDYRNKLLNIKKHFPNFKELIKLQNHKILVN